MKTIIEQGKTELILVAVELGYTFCEKGYSLEEAKREIVRQLSEIKHIPANNGGNRI